MRVLRITALMAVALAAAACGGKDDDNPGPSTSSRSVYPTGPYGTAQGGVLESFSFVTSEGQDFDIESVFKDANNKLLLISTSAGWCTACIEEQKQFNDRHRDWAAKGLFILVTMFEDRDYKPAKAMHAADWKRAHGLNYTVVADEPFVFKDFYDTTLTPMNMFVDVDKMEILSINTGADISIVDAIIQSRLGN